MERRREARPDRDPQPHVWCAHQQVRHLPGLHGPGQFPQLRGLHKDWTSEGWPKDIMIKANGDWIRGWGVEGRDGEMFSCGVLCDRLAPDYARRRIAEWNPRILASAVPLHRHHHGLPLAGVLALPHIHFYPPRESRAGYKMELLDANQPGVQPGHRFGNRPRSFGPPTSHYFEGMLSLVPTASRFGRRPATIVDEVPERVEKFQTGHFLSTAAVGAGVPRLPRSPSGTGETTTTSCRSCGSAATCLTPCTARRPCSSMQVLGRKPGTV